MAAPDLPEAILGAPEDFLAAARPQDLLYRVLNVGDGDCQLLVLPAHADGRRGIAAHAVEPASSCSERTTAPRTRATPFAPSSKRSESSTAAAATAIQSRRRSSSRGSRS